MRFDPDRWSALVSGAACPMCAEPDRELLLATLPSGHVLLQNDGDFPGYCILQFRRHATELFDLEESEQEQLARDVSRIARAVWTITQPAKMNYAILGNEVPHLHAHIVPRYPDDGWWGSPIWNRPPDRRATMDPAAYESLRRDLQAHLNAPAEETE